MIHIDAKQLGLFLKEQRQQANLNKEQLADKLHISKEEIAQWELGYSLPRHSLLIPLAKVLNVMVAELLECRRFTSDEIFSLEQTEKLVRTIISMYVKEQRHPRKE